MSQSRSAVSLKISNSMLPASRAGAVISPRRLSCVLLSSFSLPVAVAPFQSFPGSSSSSSSSSGNRICASSSSRSSSGGNGGVRLTYRSFHVSTVLSSSLDDLQLIVTKSAAKVRPKSDVLICVTKTFPRNHHV